MSSGGAGLDLSVLIVAYRSRTDLPQCLEALPAAARGLRFDITVVDNASGDGSEEWVRASHPGVRVIVNRENVGFARAVNLAAWGADGRHLLLLNADTVPAPGSLTALAAALDQDPALGLVGPRLLDGQGRSQRSAFPEPSLAAAAFEAFFLYNLWPRSRWHEARPDRAGSVACLPGTCLLVRRACFEMLSGLDERFFLYHEDFDFCLRARASGWRVALREEAQVVHRVGGSAFQDRRSFHRNFATSRRALLRKHHPGARGALLARVNELGLVLRVAAHGLVGIVSGNDAQKSLARDEAEALRALWKRQSADN